jgi:hypothetical protein
MLEAELLERDGWTRDDLLAYQRERVRALVTHAVSRSPYYRAVLGVDAAERPLGELPTLPKATLGPELLSVAGRCPRRQRTAARDPDHRYRVDRRSSAAGQCATGLHPPARARRKAACGPIGRALIKQYR